ncbi:APO protein 3 [Arachis hypogaea]|nr:APO protein 3 [Arachis hypogaea]
MNNSNLDGLTEEERNKVGLEGHKLRMRKASKHQSRNGLHVWQEATIDDLVGPNYVWHVDDLNGSPLNNNLKRYYGKAPAVVELCVHGGALVPNQYKSMMRLDVVSPDRDEVDLVA